MLELVDLLLASTNPRQTQLELEQRDSQIAVLSRDEIDRLLGKLVESIESEAAIREEVAASLQLLVHKFAQQKSADPWSPSRLQSVDQLYHKTPAAADCRNQLLHWMAASGDENGLKLWAQLVGEAPPEHRVGLVLAFAPLMNGAFDPPPWLTERLLGEPMAHMQIAPLVLDVFNFWFRSGKVESHPAEPRSQQLMTLLGQLTGQLGKIEEGNIRKDVDLLTLNMQISDSVALVVGLCDFFGLLKSETAKPKLHQAMSLRHRRIQTEAAAALAKLGDEDGKRSLLALAEEPVARLRVLKYAEELGFLKQVSLQWQGEIATAESHLAIWLSDPSQVGFAPAEIRLVDNRELNWPSYDHPVACYLFEYRYGREEAAPGNIGICGPMTHAFAADLRGLDHDDIYAAFAGWQTVHPEIFVTTLERAEAAAAGEIAALVQRLESIDEGQVPAIDFVGNFFGEWVLIAAGDNDGKAATLVVDQSDTYWIDGGNPTAPVDTETAWSIVQGRKLLAHFN